MRNEVVSGLNPHVTGHLWRMQDAGCAHQSLRQGSSSCILVCTSSAYTCQNLITRERRMPASDEDGGVQRYTASAGGTVCMLSKAWPITGLS